MSSWFDGLELQSTISGPSTEIIVVRRNAEVYAVKKLQQVCDGSLVDIPMEMRILRGPLSAWHPNLNFMSAFWYQAPNYYIFMEYCSGGDLSDLLISWHQSGHAAPPLFLEHLVASLISALAYIQLGIRDICNPNLRPFSNSSLIHGNIKPDNIFLDWRHSPHQLPRIVLGDFGQTRFSYDFPTYIGTHGYVPPEFAQSREVTASCCLPQADIYCFGAVVFSVATVRGFDNRCREYNEETIERALADHPNVSPWYLSFLTALLSPKPQDRPNILMLVHTGAHFYHYVGCELSYGFGRNLCCLRPG
ncbi:kinase-like protein [Piedraia hortae CBS 480.64]|uniref:non-specific serine/threonine protein kinase n=1 Tax=Piedraia hortae CBS 480.64 TaxID=1314780 RepID=A0A6A7C3A2_9PEZI|nr:kinase-like protein [Piedraia hortae CBS 480.64]